MAEREDGWEPRLAGATRTYVDDAALDRAPSAVVEDVTTRPPVRPRRALAVAAVALIVALSGGLAIAQLVSQSGWPPVAATPAPPTARPPQAWPEDALPAPYDWQGVREALLPRGLELDAPADEELRRQTVVIDEALTRVLEPFTMDGERARAVGVHLAAVTQRDERLGDLVRELMYVVETTGHRTGNCFTLLPATPSDAPTIGACFYPNRSAPR